MKAQNVHHTGGTMDGPWIKTVPVVSRIFDVSSSTGLGIEGFRTCWITSWDFGHIVLAFGIRVMINRDSRGHSYLFYYIINVLNNIRIRS